MSNLGFAIRSRRIAISQIYTKLSPLCHKRSSDRWRVPENSTCMLYSMFSPFVTLYSKCLLSLLSRFIRPENIPVEHGGLIQPKDFKNGPPQPCFKL
ncbi:hypothetical protein MTR_1g062480 [Medicago truncatula]|uniref:Uncharacterized protein n=1 Tax=Medicago truncatula TaxID=3880 RepID=A0A072VKH4_MEDTR|nr:hypothetical protein MTR_1g062480 [Medicago truncatula]